MHYVQQLTGMSHTIAEVTRGLAAERRLSHVALARALGISRPSMSRKLAGIQPWSAEELLHFAEVVGVPLQLGDRVLSRSGQQGISG